MGTHTTTTTTSTERGLRTRLSESFQRCAPPDFNAKTSSSPSSLQQTKDEEGDILDDIDDIDVEVGGDGRGGERGGREAGTSDRTLKGGRYGVVRMVGHGTFGEVLRCLDREDDNAVCAVKRVFLQKQVRSKESCYAATLDRALREPLTLQACAGDNVVGVRDHWHSPQVLSLALEFCDWDLRRLCQTRPELLQRESVLRLIACDLLTALTRCHEKGVVHRDVKPGNCLVHHSGMCKLGDFGQATFKGSYLRDGDGNESEENEGARGGGGEAGDMTHAVSTRWYRAPELLYGSKCYDEKVDVWSLGMTLAELRRGGRGIARGESDIDQMSKVFRCFGTPNEVTWPEVALLPDYGKIIFDAVLDPDPLSCHFEECGASEDFVDLLSRMLRLNPKERWSCGDLLRHPFLSRGEKCPREELAREAAGAPGSKP